MIEAAAQAVSEAAVLAAIGEVVDPCSRFHGTDLSLVELGMVERVSVDGTAVHVQLLLDDPLCVYTFLLQKELRERIGAIEGVQSVDIEVLPDFGWTRERVLPAARARLLDDRLVRRLSLVPSGTPGSKR